MKTIDEKDFGSRAEYAAALSWWWIVTKVDLVSVLPLSLVTPDHYGWFKKWIIHGTAKMSKWNCIVMWIIPNCILGYVGGVALWNYIDDSSTESGVLSIVCFSLVICFHAYTCYTKVLLFRAGGWEEMLELRDMMLAYEDARRPVRGPLQPRRRRGRNIILMKQIDEKDFESRAEYAAALSWWWINVKFALYAIPPLGLTPPRHYNWFNRLLIKLNAKKPKWLPAIVFPLYYLFACVTGYAFGYSIFIHYSGDIYVWLLCSIFVFTLVFIIVYSFYTRVLLFRAGGWEQMLELRDTRLAIKNFKRRRDKAETTAS